jgi:hypothetical protein
MRKESKNHQVLVIPEKAESIAPHDRAVTEQEDFFTSSFGGMTKK